MSQVFCLTPQKVSFIMKLLLIALELFCPVLTLY